MGSPLISGTRNYPLSRFWAAYKRIITPGGAIVLTAQGNFAHELYESNKKWYRPAHEWIIEKRNAVNFLNVSRSPLRAHESILVFCEKTPLYQPQLTAGTPYKRHTVETKTTNYSRGGATYGPVNDTTTINHGTRQPRSVLRFEYERGLHSTQKPVTLFENLIRTYSRSGALVLDNCIGSGTTAIAALNSGRRFIGFENNRQFFQIAQDRIKHHVIPKATPDQGHGLPDLRSAMAQSRAALMMYAAAAAN